RLAEFLADGQAAARGSGKRKHQTQYGKAGANACVHVEYPESFQGSCLLCNDACFNSKGIVFLAAVRVLRRARYGGAPDQGSVDDVTHFDLNVRIGGNQEELPVS